MISVMNFKITVTLQKVEEGWAVVFSATDTRGRTSFINNLNRLDSIIEQDIELPDESFEPLIFESKEDAVTAINNVFDSIDVVWALLEEDQKAGDWEEKV